MPIFILCILAGIAWMVLTNHSIGNHAAEKWSSLRVLEHFQKGGGKDCARLEVAACERQNGKEGFTVRGYCQLENGESFLGIWGWNETEGVYVTGFAVDYSRWKSTCARDNCLAVDISWLQRVLK
jgi:hypothetical protein